MPKSRKRQTQGAAFQFLIALLGVDPLVWRRIHVPDQYSFWDLHVAIQDAMGWQDYHLHEFALIHPEGGNLGRIGLPDEEDPYDRGVLPDHELLIAEYFTSLNPHALYTYDFGDGWRHLLAFEDYIQPEKGLTYPRCVSGQHRCPPEDCGGPGGYGRFLEAIQDPTDEEHDEYLTWIGGHFDPNDFRPEHVQFDDPVKRWQIAFSEE